MKALTTLLVVGMFATTVAIADDVKAAVKGALETAGETDPATTPETPETPETTSEAPNP